MDSLSNRAMSDIAPLPVDDNKRGNIMRPRNFSGGKSPNHNFALSGSSLLLVVLLVLAPATASIPISTEPLNELTQALEGADEPVAPSFSFAQNQPQTSNGFDVASDHPSTDGIWIEIPSDATSIVEHPIQTNVLVVEGVLRSYGELNIVAELVVIGPHGRLISGDGPRGDAAAGSESVGADGGDGFDLLITTNRLVVAQGGLLVAGSGGGGGDAVGHATAVGGNGGLGGNILITANHIHAIEYLAPGSGGNGGSASVIRYDGNAGSSTAIGGHGGNSGRSWINGVHSEDYARVAPISHSVVSSPITLPDLCEALNNALPAASAGTCIGNPDALAKDSMAIFAASKLAPECEHDAVDNIEIDCATILNRLVGLPRTIVDLLYEALPKCTIQTSSAPDDLCTQLIKSAVETGGQAAEIIFEYVESCDLEQAYSAKELGTDSSATSTKLDCQTIMEPVRNLPRTVIQTVVEILESCNQQSGVCADTLDMANTLVDQAVVIIGNELQACGIDYSTDYLRTNSGGFIEVQGWTCQDLLAGLIGSDGGLPGLPGLPGTLNVGCANVKGADGTPGVLKGGNGGDACSEVSGSKGGKGGKGDTDPFSCGAGGKGGEGTSGTAATVTAGNGGIGAVDGGDGGDATSRGIGGPGGDGGDGGHNVFWGKDCMGGPGGQGGAGTSGAATAGSGGAGLCGNGGAGGSADARAYGGSGGNGGSGNPAGAAGIAGPATNGAQTAGQGGTGPGVCNIIPINVIWE